MPSRTSNIITSVIGLSLSVAIVFVSIQSNAATAIAETTPATTPVTTVGPSGHTPALSTTPVAASATITAPSQTQPTQPQPANTSGYANGSYSSSVSYRVEHGVEGISVTLDLEDGTVTGASLSQSGSSPESARYQSAFNASYKSYVVGKKLSSLNLSRVSGSSLTTAAFNAALAQIKSQAAA